MSISMNYEQVRVFAQLLRELTGRDVKHSQILRQIAAAKTVAYDGFMHRLKNRETERVKFTEAELQCIATLLSAASKRTIERSQVESAASLTLGNDSTTPDIYVTWVTFKNAARGKISLFPFTSNKQGELPDEDFGFGGENLVDAALLAPIVADLNGTRTNGIDLKISSPFTLKLLVIPEKDNRLKSSGFQAVDQLLHALTVALAPEGTRYIIDGCVLRPSSFKGVPTVTAELTRAVEQLQPLHKKTPITITSGLERAASEPTAAHSRHNNSSSFSLLRHTLHGMTFLQSIPPDQWRKEINSIEFAARDLTFQGHNGPLNDYKHLIQSLFDALKTIVGIYELTTTTVGHDRWNDVRGLMSLIENLILKDKQSERTGKPTRREQLAKDLNSSIRQVYILSHISSRPGEEQFDWTSTWLSAIWELMHNPLWTVVDDIAIYVGKNPMTAYNGYRLSTWTPD